MSIQNTMTTTYNNLTHGLIGWLIKNKNRDATRYCLESMENCLKSSKPFIRITQQYSACSTSGDIFCSELNEIFAIIGNPVWDDKELHKLSLLKGPAYALAKAYKENKLTYYEKLTGDYAFIIIDAENHICSGSVDRLGRYPLYYYDNDEAIFFASSADALVSQEIGTTPSLSTQGIYNYVYFHMVPSPSSIYQNIKKLSSGTLFKYNENKVTITQHWLPDFQNKSSASFSKLSLKLRTHLKSSVKNSIDPTKKTGAFLSGGLDSSTVVGMFAELEGNKAEAFSIGFSAEGYDEMAYARITAKHFQVPLHEYYVTPEDVVDALPMVAGSYDEPFGNSSALPAYFCAKLAKEHGIERLLAGDGGDELFAGNERYSKQFIFEHYHKIPEWMRKNLIGPLLGSTYVTSKFSIFRKVASYITQANIPLPERLQTYNFLHRHQPSEIFNQDFLDSIDVSLPMKQYRDIFIKPEHASTLDRMLYLDWQYTLADNDLRKVSHMCAIAGVEVVYPMLDDKLLDFSCSIPDQWKLKGNKLRYFYKASLNGWLPEQTIKKKKQGFGLPFGIWMRNHKPLQNMAYDSLSELRKRQYFNPEFIDNLIRMHKYEHAAYYGELVWILTVLEIWLSTHTSANH